MHKIKLGVYLLSALFLAACNSHTPASKTEIYKVTKPIIADTAFKEEYVSELHAVENIEIRCRVKGFIESILVDEGQTVQKGQILFKLSSQGYQQELLKAEAAWKNELAELKAAEIELENTEKLFAKKIIAKSELDLAKAKLEMHKAKVEEAKAHEWQAQHNLSFTLVRAPFDGIINRIPNKKGSLVDEGTLLTTLSNNKEMLAYFNVSESDYLDYAVTTHWNDTRTVSLVLANGTPYEQVGHIETVESEFDPLTGNIAFRARFPNPKKILKHGSNGKIVVRKQLKKALLIPQKSTFEIQDKVFVFVVKEDSTLEQRNISIKKRLPHVYVVSSGLAPQEQILLEGTQNVKPGDKISIQN
jgi:RND family efflux transporter MFP subunit